MISPVASAIFRCRHVITCILRILLDEQNQCLLCDEQNALPNIIFVTRKPVLTRDNASFILYGRYMASVGGVANTWFIPTLGLTQTLR